MSAKENELLGHILDELREHRSDLNMVRQEHRTDMNSIRQDINKLAVDVGGLKIKSGIWGAVAGFVPGALLFLSMLLKGATP